MQPLNVKWPPPGRYLLAVSGGADSMVLLDLFAHAAADRSYQLTVAHFNHGVRSDAAQDQQLVGATAAHFNLPFVSETASLAGASEATARAARHGWLDRQRRVQNASAILTAHHQNDLLETSLLNLARGSGRFGLAPMASTATILRPLMAVTRQDLRTYAAAHNVAWREDSTNADLSNPRNFIRHRLLPAAPAGWPARYLELIENLAELNTKIDQSISEMLDAAQAAEHTYSFPKKFIQTLSLAELEEVILAAARRLQPGIQLDSRLVREVAAFAKTGQTGKFRPLRQGVTLQHTRSAVNLTTKSPL